MHTGKRAGKPGEIGENWRKSEIFEGQDVLYTEIGGELENEAFWGFLVILAGRVRKMGKMKGQDRVYTSKSIDCVDHVDCDDLPNNVRGNSAITCVMIECRDCAGNSKTIKVIICV